MCVCQNVCPLLQMAGDNVKVCIMIICDAHQPAPSSLANKLPLVDRRARPKLRLLLAGGGQPSGRLYGVAVRKVCPVRLFGCRANAYEWRFCLFALCCQAPVCLVPTNKRLPGQARPAPVAPALPFGRFNLPLDSSPSSWAPWPAPAAGHYWRCSDCSLGGPDPRAIGPQTISTLGPLTAANAPPPSPAPPSSPPPASTYTKPGPTPPLVPALRATC